MDRILPPSPGDDKRNVPRSGHTERKSGGLGADVSPAHPCPVCGKPDWCTWYADGDAVFCQRATSGGKPSKGGKPGRTIQRAEWRHAASAPEPGAAKPKRSKPRDVSDPTYQPYVDHWTAIARDCAENLTDEYRALLADEFGIPVGALDLVAGIGAYDEYEADIGFWSDDLRKRITNFPVPPLTASNAVYTFPERDGRGNIIGGSTRHHVAGKKFLHEGARGLTLPAKFDPTAPALHIVEGASDTLAMLAAGLMAVGRPSNVGGIEYLADFILRDVPEGMRVIWWGENDRKADGRWPGNTFPEAQKIAKMIGRPVGYVRPPEPHKDVRATLIRMEVPWLDRGQLLENDALSRVETYGAKKPISCPALMPEVAPAKEDTTDDNGEYGIPAYDLIPERMEFLSRESIPRESIDSRDKKSETNTLTYIR